MWTTSSILMVNSGSGSAGTRLASLPASVLTLVAAGGMVLILALKQRLALRMMGMQGADEIRWSAVGAGLILLAWLFLPRTWRGRALLLLVVDFLCTLLLYSDVLYFREYGEVLSAATLRFSNQLITVYDAVWPLLRRSDWRIWADLPVLLAFSVFAVRILPRRVEERPFRSRLAMTAVIVIIGASLIGWALRSQKKRGVQLWLLNTYMLGHVGPLCYHGWDLVSYLDRPLQRMLPSRGATQETRQWLAKHETGQTSPSAWFGAAMGKNLIVVQMESFQAFVLDLRVNGEEITPNLNRLSRESIVLTNLYSQTGQGRTADADLLANCSQYAGQVGAVYYDYPDDHFRCLPALLRAHGYHAIAIQGIQPDFWNLDSVYPRLGFERYYNSSDGLVKDEMIGAAISDESMLRQAVPILLGTPEPYYAFVVTFSSHTPFTDPRIPHVMRLGALEGSEMGNYLHAIRYADTSLGDFLDKLRRAGALDRSMLVMYGDHAGVNPRKLRPEDMPASEAVTPTGLMRFEHRVVGLIRLPGGKLAGPFASPAGEVDLAPTIAGLAGVPVHGSPFMGDAMNTPQERVVVFNDGSALTSAGLYWSATADSGEGQCYRLADGTRLSSGDCFALAKEASTRLRISRLMVQRDLFRDLAAQK